MEDLGRLTELWSTRWPRCRPLVHELRLGATDRWVRFHSFPGTQRYPQSSDDVDMALDRHNTVLAELFRSDIHWGGGHRPLLVSTSSWSDSATPTPRHEALIRRQPGASYWQSISLGEPGFDSWVHLWVNRQEWVRGSIDPLLELVMADQADGVLLADGDLRWLYYPYDGGADVIAPSPHERDELARRHATWTSRREVP